MMVVVARALMALTERCLGDHRRAWALAMRAEFEVAAEEQKPLTFAMGCLLAALREMPTQEEGRFVLANYALVLCLMIPMAALQIGCAALGFPYLFVGQGGLRGAIAAGSTQEMLLGSTYQAAVPSFSLLLLLLGIGHLRIAWAMLERDWSRVISMGALTLAATATLVIFMTALFLDATQPMLQAAVLAIELAAVSVVTRWHAQLQPLALQESP